MPSNIPFTLDTPFFDYLPDELLVNILRGLDKDAFLACIHTCRRLLRIGHEPLFGPLWPLRESFRTPLRHFRRDFSVFRDLVWALTLPDGRLANVDNRGEIHLYHPDTPDDCVIFLMNSEGSYTPPCLTLLNPIHLACSADSPHGSADVVIWNIDALQYETSIHFHGKRVTCMTALDERTLAIGFNAPGLCIWRPDTDETAEVAAQAEHVRALCKLDDTRLLVGEINGLIALLCLSSWVYTPLFWAATLPPSGARRGVLFIGRLDEDRLCLVTSGEDGFAVDRLKTVSLRDSSEVETRFIAPRIHIEEISSSDAVGVILSHDALGVWGIFGPTYRQAVQLTARPSVLSPVVSQLEEDPSEAPSGCCPWRRS